MVARHRRLPGAPEGPATVKMTSRSRPGSAAEAGLEGSKRSSEGDFSRLLSAIPLDELVHLDISYEIDTGDGVIVTPSPLSRRLPLRQAIEEAVSLIGTGARVSITARGITYSDPYEFLSIWSGGNGGNTPK
jgi:hypothetical protein